MKCNSQVLKKADQAGDEENYSGEFKIRYVL